jgi:tetratricopeptide (TPR) repeat protein
LGEQALRDSTVRGPISDEIERAIAESPYNARSQAFAGNLAMLEGRFVDAARNFDEAARQHPYETVVRDRQGLAHLLAGDLSGAEHAFRAADAAPGPWTEKDLREGQLLAARGQRDAARRAYERSLARHPELTEASDSLAAMGR